MNYVYIVVASGYRTEPDCRSRIVVPTSEIRFIVAYDKRELADSHAQLAQIQNERIGKQYKTVRNPLESYAPVQNPYDIQATNISFKYGVLKCEISNELIDYHSNVLELCDKNNNEY